MKRRSSTDSQGQEDLWHWADRQPQALAASDPGDPPKPAAEAPGHRDGLIRRLLGGMSPRPGRSG